MTMTLMRAWLQIRRERAFNRAYRRGFDWAAGELLRDHAEYVNSQLYWCNPAPLHSRTSEAWTRGANAAFDAYEKLTLTNRTSLS